MAQDIVSKVREKLQEFQGKILFTRDTHQENYMETQEGENLPVPHCIKGTEGWEIIPQLREYVKEPPGRQACFRKHGACPKAFP